MCSYHINQYYKFVSKFKQILEAIFFFFITIIIGVTGWIIYQVYVPFKYRFLKSGKLSKKRSKQINTIYLFIILLSSAYITYGISFPDDSFFKDEFSKVTLREIPGSAVFIEKSTDIPDFHGDYCSSSQIQLSPEDYTKLLNELKNDTIFSPEQQLGSDGFTKTLAEKKPGKIKSGFKRDIEGKNGHYYYIGFYEDGITIFVNICII